MLLFVSIIVLGVLMHQRNQKRSVALRHVSWEDNRPIWMPKDSVNKLLKLALKDSVSAFKSGLNLRNIEQTLISSSTNTIPERQKTKIMKIL